MGRRKLPEQQRRTKTVAVRLTQAGYDKIKMLAESRGMSMDAYVRLVMQKIYEGAIILPRV